MRMLVLLLIQYFILIFSGEAFTSSAFIPPTKLISQPKWKHHSQKDIDVPLLSTFMTASSMDSGSGDIPFNVDILSHDTTDSNTDENKKFDMPWTDIQQFAIQDNISKFTVTIPEMGRDSISKAKQYVMWRALTREVPELAGYPISFLLQKLTTQLGVLPLVDDFEFTSNGGISGRAYGLQGIADGTKIQTPPLIRAETTVPLGYITTQGDASTSEDDIGFSYELGLCSSLDSIGRTTGRSDGTALAAARRFILDDGALLDTTKQVAGAAKDIGTELLSDQEANRDMIYLGGATTLLIFAATAVGILSHHLTVNVFWV